jgi:LCP family protein required for cell wall assembly
MVEDKRPFDPRDSYDFGRSQDNAPEPAATTNPGTPSIPLPPPMAQPRGLILGDRGRHKRRRRTEWLWVILPLAMFGLVIVVGGIILAWPSGEPESEAPPTATVDLAALPTAANFRTGIDQQFESGEPITLDDGYTFVLDPWDGDSRFTMLLLGIDRRPGDTSLSHLTDTIMVISIDPDTDRIGILSIPRDLYVRVPGYGSMQRINTAMLIGEARRDITGPELAMQAVQYNLGMRIHEYLVVDFQAFIGLVDTIGGITVTIDYTINDPKYPDMTFGYDPFYLPAGTHHLNGYDALRFARTRHGNSDIDRAERQQQVIYAIRDRILSTDSLPQLIFRAPSLLDTFEDNLYTKLSLGEMIELAWYVKDVPADNIHTGVIDYRYVDNWETPDESQVLIPAQARLPQLMIEVFGENYSE